MNYDASVQAAGDSQLALSGNEMVAYVGLSRDSGSLLSIVNTQTNMELGRFEPPGYTIIAVTPCTRNVMRWKAGTASCVRGIAFDSMYLQMAKVVVQVYVRIYAYVYLQISGCDHDQFGIICMIMMIF